MDAGEAHHRRHLVAVSVQFLERFEPARFQTNRLRQSFRKRNDGFDLHRIDDDDCSARVHERSNGSLRQSLAGFVDQQPTERSQGQTAQHSLN